MAKVKPNKHKVRKEKYNPLNVEGFQPFSKKSIRSFVLILIIFLFLLNVPTIYAYALYSYNYIRCGKAPVMSSDFAGQHPYWLPSDKKYYKIRPDSIYFCTEADARADERRTPAEEYR